MKMKVLSNQEEIEYYRVDSYHFNHFTDVLLTETQISYVIDQLEKFSVKSKKDFDLYVKENIDTSDTGGMYDNPVDNWTFWEEEEYEGVFPLFEGGIPELNKEIEAIKVELMKIYSEYISDFSKDYGALENVIAEYDNYWNKRFKL